MSATCPSCGEATVAGASFCEACGADLPAGPACVSCGADAVEGDYCLECGHRQPGPRDHIEQRQGRVVGVTDKGHRHHGNEDAMALDDTPAGARILVVCDGVSTTDRSDEASQAAAEAAAEALVAAAEESFDPAAAFRTAAAAAQAAVKTVPIDPGAKGSPSCTFVAAVVEAADADGVHRLHVGWLGDSRAYWISPQPELLTHDHSWANELVAAGRLDPAEAMNHPQAHTITRFLGADAIDLEPSVETRLVQGPGTVLVCSDGLWNYAPDAETLATRPEWGIADLETRAGALTRFALDSGGHDNITVVITDIDPASDQNGPGADTAEQETIRHG